MFALEGVCLCKPARKGLELSWCMRPFSQSLFFLSQMSQGDRFGMVRKPILPLLPRPQWLYTSPRRVCPLGTAERRGGGHWRKAHTGLTRRKAPLRPHKPQPALSSPNITTLSFSCLPVPSAHYLLGEASLSAKWNASLSSMFTLPLLSLPTTFLCSPLGCAFCGKLFETGERIPAFTIPQSLLWALNVTFPRAPLVLP